MAFGCEDKDRIICPMCKIIAVKLVPLYDNDQKHKNTQCCVSCKRNIRAGKDIVKVKKDDVGLKKYLETIHKPRKEVTKK